MLQRIYPKGDMLHQDPFATCSLPLSTMKKTKNRPKKSHLATQEIAVKSWGTRQDAAEGVPDKTYRLTAACGGKTELRERSVLCGLDLCQVLVLSGLQ
jgi:hypothetical protein